MSFEVPPHPKGLLPSGNRYDIDAGRVKAVSSRDAGLGCMSVLGDDMVLHILSFCEPASLFALAGCSRSLHAFSHHEDLWRALVLQAHDGDFSYAGSWRETMRAKCGAPAPTRAHSSTDDKAVVRVDGVYSDLLFQPWLCATTPLRADWTQTERGIDRRSNLSLEEFISEYEIPNRPVILTDVVQDWPAARKWDRKYLLDRCKQADSDTTWSVGHFQMRLEQYYRYMDRNVDDQPLYLFDPKFADKVPVLGDEYSVPKYFDDCLFKLCHPRPNHRWLIFGPARSGSTYHVDPNGTSAWNAVISGAKKWVMYPPDAVPPGVVPSSDGADVACPVSLVEWFLDFYDVDDATRKKRVECVCREGELLFIPRGWWHTALNLDETIALTQNFVSPRNVTHVLSFLKNKSDQVSGLASGEGGSLFQELSRRLREERPECIAEHDNVVRGDQKRRKLFTTDHGANDGQFAFGF